MLSVAKKLSKIELWHTRWQRPVAGFYVQSVGQLNFQSWQLYVILSVVNDSSPNQSLSDISRYTEYKPLVCKKSKCEFTEMARADWEEESYLIGDKRMSPRHSSPNSDSYTPQRLRDRIFKIPRTPLFWILLQQLDTRWSHLGGGNIN